MNIKPKNKILTLLITIILILAMLVVFPSVSAEKTCSCSDISPNYIDSSSSSTAIMKLSVQSDETGVFLDKVFINFTGATFSTNDFLPINKENGTNSGVTIWMDHNNPNGDRVFNTVNDSNLPEQTAQWDGSIAKITLLSGGDNRFDFVDTTYTFYVVIKTSATISDNEVITANITTVQVKNTDATVSGTRTATLTSDTQSPVVPSNALTAPDGGEQWSGTQEITWNHTEITDSHFNSTPIALYYSDDGGSNWNLIASGLENNGTYNWDTTSGPADGTNYKVNITATDNASNSAYDISNATFTIDNTGPVCTGVEYNRSASFFTSGTKIKIFANFTETGSGMDNSTVNITIDTSNGETLSETNMNKTNFTNYFWNWTIPSGSEHNGIFTVTITAKDNASNDLASTTDNSKSIDNSPPSATIGVPVHTNYYKTLTTINGTCTDGPGSGISTVNITAYNTSSGKYWNFSGADAGWATGKNWSSSATLEDGYTTWTITPDPAITWENGTTYVVNATATDNVSISGLGDSNNFTYDTDGITSNVSSIDTYWQTTSPLSLTYTATDYGSGLDQVTLYYRNSSDNDTFSSWTVWTNDSNPDTTPNSPVTWSFDFPNASGYYEFRTLAVDNVGNSETKGAEESDIICGYDAVDPTAVINVPQDEGYYNSQITNITGTAYDPQFVTLVNLTIYNSSDGTYFNGAGWQASSANLSANKTSGTSTINWWYENTSAFPTWTTGTNYTINVSAKDTAGNWNLTAATSSFNYDTEDPTTTIDEPDDAKWYNNSLANITGTASDTDWSGLLRINVTIYNATDGEYWDGDSDSWVVAETNLTATGTSNWYYDDLPSWKNGTNYTINASATDNALNVGSKDTNTFYMDTDDLESSVTAISPYWNTTGTQMVNFTASDTGSGLYNVTLYYNYSSDNSSGWSAWTNFSDGDDTPHNPTAWTFDFPSGEGFYKFRTVATDNASNTESVTGEDAICGYDGTDPFVNITSIVDNDYYSSVSYISGDCNDGGPSGVKEVNITVYNVTAGKYWNFSGADAGWATGKNWSSSATLEDGYTTWNYTGASSVTWQNGKSYIISATTVDNATLTSTEDSKTFRLDTTAPTVDIEMTESTYVTNGDVVRVFANFTEDGSGIDESTVELSIANVTGGTTWLNSSESMIKDDSTHYYFDWHVQSGENCDVTVYVNASDNVSQSVSGTNSTKTIDNTAPVCQIQYNKTATYFKENDLLKVYANFTESGSGITEPVKISVDYAEAGSDFTSQDMNKTSNLEWYYNLTMPANNNGTISVSITATDNVSLSATSNTSSIKKVDNSGPTATIDGISDYVTSLTEVTGTSNDGTGVGINKTEVKIFNMTDNTNWTGSAWTDADNWNSTTGYSTWTLDTSGITWVDGNQYRVYAKSTDNLTNVGSTVNDSFTFDEGDPLVTSVLINDTTIGSTTYVKNTDTVNVTITYSDATLDSSSANSLFKADLSALGGDSSTNATAHNDTHAWWEHTVSGSGDGTVTVTINVTDEFGNYNNTESDTILADNTAPTLNYAVLDSDNDGSSNSYIDVYFSEDIDTDTTEYTDFNISEINIDTQSIQSESGNLVTIQLDDVILTGDSPTVGVDGSISDFAGNTITSGTKKIYTYRISLDVGWNLISFPAYIPSGTDIGTLLNSISGNYDIVWSYDPDGATADDIWTSYNPNPLAASSLTSIQQGRGYWIEMTSADNLTGNYNQIHVVNSNPNGNDMYWPGSINLTTSGWNLIGHWNEYEQSADTGGAFSDIDSEFIGSIISQDVSPVSNLVPGEGYWFWVKRPSGDTRTHVEYAQSRGSPVC